MGKQHKIKAQVDRVEDEIIIEDVSLQTDSSLLIILQGEIAEDPDNVDITVVCRLPEVLYFDWHFCFVRKSPEGCWVNPLGEFKDIKTGEVKGKGKKFLIQSGIKNKIIIFQICYRHML